MKPIYYHDFGKQKRNTPNKFLSDEAGQWQQLYGKSLKIFSFYIYWEKYSFWFRIFGYGIAGKKKKKTWKVYFSERNGYRKMYNFIGWKFEFLRPT